MIEMLVTVSIFSLVAAGLLLGLHSGARAYQSARAKQARAGALEAMLRVFTADVRQVGECSKTFAPVAEERQEKRESLLITTLEQGLRQRAGQGAVWNRVTYELQDDASSGQTNLVRIWQGYVSVDAVLDDEKQQILLRDVDSLAFSYYADGVSLDEWQEEERLPQLVELRIRAKGLPPTSKAAWLGAREVELP